MKALTKKADPKVLIAIPTMATVPVDFMRCLMNLERPENSVLGIVSGSLVYDARNYLYKYALDKKCDYIMWIDSDMIFPSDILKRMLRTCEEKNLDYLSGLYVTRRTPVEPVLYKTVEWTQDEHGLVSHKLEMYSDYPKDSFFEVQGSGFGCLLTKLSLVEKVTVAWQMSPFTPLPGLGEDLSFCYKARDLGYKLYCDSSIKCGHIGEHIFLEGDLK